MLVTLFVVGAPTAHAGSVEISLDTVVHAPEGSVTLLATSDTPPGFVGMTCPVVVESNGQASVHPGNDLIVRSGGSSVTLEDVERAPGAVTKARGKLTLGPVVTVPLVMGADGVFSGGMTLTFDECEPPPPTTTTTLDTTTTTSDTTTTTLDTTTTTIDGIGPEITIEKTANPIEYGADGVGHFTIVVTNTGTVDLTNVQVTDEVALAIDPDSDCAQPTLPDLAVGESFEYQCAVSNLDGVSPFTNEATAIGTSPEGVEVTDTDEATVFPPVLATTITQAPPPTSPPASVPDTLPVTGASYEQMRAFGVAGLSILLVGMALLGTAALIGWRNEQRRAVVAAGLGYKEIQVDVLPQSHDGTFFILLRKMTEDRGQRTED